jgi:hypothetical protein
MDWAYIELSAEVRILVVAFKEIEEVLMHRGGLMIW